MLEILDTEKLEIQIDLIELQLFTLRLSMRCTTLAF